MPKDLLKDSGNRASGKAQKEVTGLFPKPLVKLLILSLLLLGLPPLGVLLSGKDPAPYLAFPPVTRLVIQPRFSWLVFLSLAPLPIAAAALFAAWLRLPPAGADPPFQKTKRPFPWWGRLGVILLAAAWVMAWTRFAWFARWQSFTFSPLWTAYIIVINALTFQRTGRCLLTSRPGLLIALFPFSASFWWYFEYLNRFVQNWHYVGAAAMSPMEYFLLATPPFATVLPAVSSTTEWLETFPTLGRERKGPLTPAPRRPRLAAWLALLLAAAGLTGIGVRPQYLFPLLWLSPLAIILALEALSGEETVFAKARAGDWRPVLLPAAAGLLCGLLWEMWNYFSFARWEYTVPFVQRFQVFEMPILGYAGYLPFGLFCSVVSEEFARLTNYVII